MYVYDIKNIIYKLSNHRRGGEFFSATTTIFTSFQIKTLSNLFHLAAYAFQIKAYTSSGVNEHGFNSWLCHILAVLTLRQDT